MKRLGLLLILTALSSCDDQVRQGNGLAGEQARTPGALQSIVSPTEAAASQYPFVWVAETGEVYELDDWDRKYLETPFTTTDEARPQIKASLGSKDEWGAASGFLAREHLTDETPINSEPVKRLGKPSVLPAGYEDYVARREVLSAHETIAEFQGLFYRACDCDVRGCPESCSESGEFSMFRIVKYRKYQRDREQVHDRLKEFLLRVSDFHRKPIDPELELLIRALEKGDRILLSWRNEEVIMNEAFSDMHAPESLTGGVPVFALKERVVERLQKMRQP